MQIPKVSTGSTFVFLSSSETKMKGSVGIFGIPTQKVNTTKKNAVPIITFQIGLDTTKENEFYALTLGSVADVSPVKADQRRLLLGSGASVQYWVSVDFHSNVIKFGMAEPKSSNTLAVFDTSLKDYSIITIEPRDMDGIKTPYNLLPAAVPNFDYDLRIKNLTGNSIKVSALYKHLQILYDLATSDLEGFNEDLIEQIRHGLREGGPLANNRGYLRVPVDESAGYAPGQMVVLEIWPAGRQSSIHCHGFANAVIKVLHGSIDVELFDPLFHGCSDPIARETFTKGDVTWITPFHNQTHRLRNTTNDVAITVQCYEHSEALVPNPLEVFHYIGSESSIEEFRPTADFNGIPGLKAVLSPSSSSTPDLITPPATPSSRSRLSPQSSRTTSSNTRVVSTPHCSREGCKNPKFDGKDYCSRICEAFA